MMEKATLITGASSDIGAAIALRLSSMGRSLILTGRDPKKLAALETQIKQNGGAAISLPADLGSHSGVVKLVEQMLKEARQFSGLVHVAGVWHDGPKLLYGPRFHEVEWREIEQVMNVSLLSFIELCHLMIPHFTREGSERIVAISGTFSSGGAKWAHYYIAKQSLEVTVRAFSDEYRESGIRVNAISPADVNTEPMRAHFPDDAATGLAPSDVADMVGVLFDSSGRNVSGQTIVLRRRDP